MPGFLEHLTIPGQALVAQIWNPKYSGGRDREDQSSRPTRANSSQYPI
jgi:hypothetical protein